MLEYSEICFSLYTLTQGQREGYHLKLLCIKLCFFINGSEPDWVYMERMHFMNKIFEYKKSIDHLNLKCQKNCPHSNRKYWLVWKDCNFPKNCINDVCNISINVIQYRKLISNLKWKLLHAETCTTYHISVLISRYSAMWSNLML